ncbi:MAG: SCO family protein [Flavitalea sp.]
MGESNHQIASFSMINQDGKTIVNKNWEGKIIIVNFFFTHCPIICPKITANLVTVEQKFINDSGVQINSFSIDPDRDSSARLSWYGSKFMISPERWNLLTGNKKEIYRLARKSFLAVATDGDGGPDDFIHSDQLVLIDTKGRIRGFYDGVKINEITQLIIDIGKLKTERSSD